VTIEDRINNMLCRYLKDVAGIETTNAELPTETEIYNAGNEGCYTCGYGSSENEMSFNISYIKDLTAFRWNDRYGYYEVKGDPLGFFPELLKYDTKD
jgi:hypothetical protein